MARALISAREEFLTRERLKQAVQYFPGTRRVKEARWNGWIYAYAGAGLALQNVAKTPGQTDTQLNSEALLLSKMEELRSTSFTNLPTGTNVSPFSTSTIRVDIAFADPSGGFNPSANFKSITATCNGISLVTLVCKP